MRWSKRGYWRAAAAHTAHASPSFVTSCAARAPSPTAANSDAANAAFRLPFMVASRLDAESSQCFCGHWATVSPVLLVGCRQKRHGAGVDARLLACRRVGDVVKGPTCVVRNIQIGRVRAEGGNKGGRGAGRDASGLARLRAGDAKEGLTRVVRSIHIGRMRAEGSDHPLCRAHRRGRRAP